MIEIVLQWKTYYTRMTRYAIALGLSKDKDWRKGSKKEKDGLEIHRKDFSIIVGYASVSFY